MNVLSLFDGMSCGRIALERAGLPVENYFASEIDKYATAISQKNYPDIVRLGDVTKWETWTLPKIDLLIGGSPCQGFSKSGYGLNFADPRSKLFFTYVDILEDLKAKNPDLIFLLENVMMKKEWVSVISNLMGVEPIEINSALVSAQNRRRLYWTNVPGIEQPKDKGIFLKDIVEGGDVDRDKSYCVDANYYKGGNPKSYFGKGRRQLVFVGGIEEGRRLDDGKSLSRNFREGYRIYSDEGKSSALSAAPKGGIGGYTGLYRIGTATDIKGHDYNKRIYSVEGKSPSLAANSGGNLEPKIAVDGYCYRKLTPVECERLQTVPEGFTSGVSNTQRYKMLGNGWTVDVIAHIFSYIKMNND